MRFFITSDLNLGHNEASTIYEKVIDTPQYASATQNDVLVLLSVLTSMAAFAEPAVTGALTLFKDFRGYNLLVVGNQDLGLDQEDPNYSKNQSLMRYEEWFPQIAQRNGFVLLDNSSIRLGNVGIVGCIGPLTADEIISYPAYHELSTDLNSPEQFELSVYNRFREHLAEISDARVIAAFMHFPPIIPKPETIERMPAGWEEFPKEIQGRKLLVSQFWEECLLLEIDYIFCASFHAFEDWGPVHYTHSEPDEVKFLWVEITEQQSSRIRH